MPKPGPGWLSQGMELLTSGTALGLLHVASWPSHAHRISPHPWVQVVSGTGTPLESSSAGHCRMYFVS